MPILVGLGGVLPVRRVLEFGCGRFSTLSFLDRDAFPDLVSVNSYEDDAEWSRQVAAAAAQDPRLRLELVPHPIHATAARVPLGGYDLIFIDDSTRWQDRVATIRQVAERCGTSPLVVIHDYEFPSYRKAASFWPHRFEFSALNPATGVVWMKASVDRSGLRRMNALIQRCAGEIEPDDLRRWVKVLRGAQSSPA